MVELNKVYQLKVYDNMHNIVGVKTFNNYPTIEDIQDNILENGGIYAKIEERYYTTKKEQYRD